MEATEADDEHDSLLRPDRPAAATAGVPARGRRACVAGAWFLSLAGAALVSSAPRDGGAVCAAGGAPRAAYGAQPPQLDYAVWLAQQAASSEEAMRAIGCGGKHPPRVDAEQIARKLVALGDTYARALQKHVSDSTSLRRHARSSRSASWTSCARRRSFPSCSTRACTSPVSGTRAATARARPPAARAWSTRGSAIASWCACRAL